MLKMLAFDFGASSGRAILGTLSDGVLKTEEIHRFSNDPVQVGDRFYWDTLRLWHDIRLGLQKAQLAGHSDIATIGIDTWGVDYGLLDARGRLTGSPVHYRDMRTEAAMEAVFARVPAEEVYGRTGIQFMSLNTLFQLFAAVESQDPQMVIADKMLLTPDLFGFFLTGRQVAERSIASTTQMVSPVSGNWDKELLEKLGIPVSILPEIVDPATVVGPLRPELAEEFGMRAARLVTSAGHDTQAAIVAVPAEEAQFVYISCGTWSLLGTELDSPVLTEEARQQGFTNELGVGGKVTFLKNIMGLWLMQESRRQWEREGQTLDFFDIERQAAASEGFLCFVDPTAEDFVSPGDMPGRIRAFCRKTGQPEPQTVGEIARCINESLALTYRYALETLEGMTGNDYQAIHMVGGGIQSRLLCTLTARATGRRVVAGPVEGTGAGNLLVQAMAAGVVKDLHEARQIVKNSFPTEAYLPEARDGWDEAYATYKRILGK